MACMVVRTAEVQVRQDHRARAGVRALRHPTQAVRRRQHHYHTGPLRQRAQADLAHSRSEVVAR
eukprot:8544310-Pyramimonas_sp.AAC.1